MVTHKNNQPKMTRLRRDCSSVSSGFRLLDADQCDTVSSISRNSIYKLKIDSMFDDSKSVISHLVDERSSCNVGKKNSSNCGGGSTRSISRHQELQNDVQRVSNTVQAQIERMFTDVAKDATSCSFPVRCLGSLPLKDKVTSLLGLQEPLRQLYLNGAGQGNQNAGNLDICASGLRVRLTNGRDANTTSFHNIAVWSAVKFIVSATEGGAAFLPLITDPENIDKSSLFRPLSASDKRRLSSGLHAPIFAVVMRSVGLPKQLECHAFVCQTPEDAIVIAATLYQSLMNHMGSSQNQKSRKPRNQNGVSCISIGSSSVANSNGNCHLFGSTTSMSLIEKLGSPRLRAPSRPPRKKRSASSSLSGESDIIREALIETTTEERKKKSHKTRRAPPIPSDSLQRGTTYSSFSYRSDRGQRKPLQNILTDHSVEANYKGNDQSNGDIFTRVAIPRSGSFLNTSGLTRYKSRATRRAADKNGGGGGGRSPLGFSELFNEFRLQENLHSLDDILNAIINSDGMSFNDLKPIYKEFLLKLAVTLTKDELYQRSKSIMRRQKKKKLRRKNSSAKNQRRNALLGSKGLKKIFWFGKFRATKFKKFKPMKHIDVVALKGKKEEHIRTGTSSSDVSEQRNEHTLNGQNRNSSSGYVSCSECSYDSEACTCTSADRCYCSLGADHEHVNAKLHKTANRDSLFSCHTEDKCYCSVSDGNGNSSFTTWCDSDSCISTSKCYCQRIKVPPGQGTKHHGHKADKLALDYELFTVGSGNKTGKPVKATEALSVKKSVEMAALFSGVKLSQTTDITSIDVKNKLCKNGPTGKKNKKKNHSNARKQENQLNNVDIEQSLRKHLRNDEIYQPIATRPVSASLEDSLGYLP